MLATPSLQNSFDRLREAAHEGVPGVICIHASKPGPVVGITVCTHGNEPSGLAVVQYLLDTVRLETSLLCGTVYLALNNLRATEAFFTAVTEEEVRRARYCDINMNRLPPGCMGESHPQTYEVRRAQELLPVWKRFEAALDIHSTLENSLPMIISRGGVFHADLVRGFPIRTLLSHIDTVQVGKPAFGFYGTDEAKVLAIEAGQHTAPASYDRACACAHAFLANLGMLTDAPGAKSENVYEEFYIEQSVIFPDMSFDFVKEFRSFDIVHADEVLAESAEGAQMRAPFEGHIVMPTLRRGKEKDITEEVGFLSRPVKVHCL